MQHIFDTIEKYHMIEPGMHIVAGVSGGADSVCLLLALCEYRKKVAFDLTAVHVEHGIRGEESLKDASFVEELCARLFVPLFVHHIDVPRLAEERKLSLEEAARAQRYRIFEEVRGEKGSSARIAVAHNRGDQAETVLWNLARGSGLVGLGGMRPVRGNIIRPLLFTDRAHIEEILHKAGVAWRTDATNLETQYTRNKIRLSVLPQMERELNAQTSLHIAQTAQQLWQVQEYLERQVAKARACCLVTEETGVKLLLSPFFEEDELIRSELVRAAIGTCAGGLRDIGNVHIRDVLSLCEKDCGKRIDLPGGVEAVRVRDTVRFSRKACGAGNAEKVMHDIRNVKGGTEDDLAESRREIRKNIRKQRSSELPVRLCIPGETESAGFHIRTELLANSGAILEQVVQEKKYTKWFSYDIIKGNVILRTRQTGDYVTVNAQGGRKKLKDYFIDQKIPRQERDSVLLLADGPHILWVVGARISETAKVCRGTEKVLKIQLEEIAR